MINGEFNSKILNNETRTLNNLNYYFFFCTYSINTKSDFHNVVNSSFSSP